jgi:type II secretory pathway component PulF
VTSSDTLMIDSAEKAGRYLSGLGGSLGFDEAVRRVESRSSPAIRSQLQALARWTRGETAKAPGPAFSLIGTVVRDGPAQGDIGKAIGAADRAREDARVLADHVRGTMLNGVPYLVLLLIVAGVVALIWLAEIAPMFRQLYAQMAVALPGLSRFFVAYPWTIAGAILVVSLALIGIFLAGRRLARSVEAVAPLGAGLSPRIIGASVRKAHDTWCVLALARAWAAAGEEPAQAAHRALQVLGADPAVKRQLDAEMQLAAELGAAGSELEHLAQTSATAYRDALELWRAVWLRSLQLAVAAVVGLVVIAVYLPIFKMGAIV